MTLVHCMISSWTSPGSISSTWSAVAWAQNSRPKKLNSTKHHVFNQPKRCVMPWQPPKVKAVDRKSTRLNSSHVSISYAVFCLKKKNIEEGKSNAIVNVEKHIQLKQDK